MQSSPRRLMFVWIALGTLSPVIPLRAQQLSTTSVAGASSSSVESASLLLPEEPLLQVAASSSSQASPAPATPNASPAPAATGAAAQDPAQNPAQTAPQTAAKTAAQTKADAHAEAERQLQVEEKQRLLGVMPQFQVVMGGSAAPLSAGQKWQLAAHTAIDPFYIGYAFVVGGGYGELVDSHSGFHWGPGGYFKRVGASYADNVDGALIGNALLPVLLHQDPRYFRKGTGSIGKRFLYAAESTVVCHGDNGKNQFNFSNVAGNFIAGAISNAYYPADERGVGLTLQNGLEVTAFGAVGGQILEFGPDLARLVTKHHRNAQARAQAQAQSQTQTQTQTQTAPTPTAP